MFLLDLNNAIGHTFFFFLCCIIVVSGLLPSAVKSERIRQNLVRKYNDR